MRAALTMACLTALVATALITLHQLLQPALDAEHNAATERHWLSWLPDGSFDNAPLMEPISLSKTDAPHKQPAEVGYLARLNGAISARLLPASAPGYEGPIELMVAVGADGKILASRVTQQRETPGLANLNAPQRSLWLQRFNGKGLEDNWRLRADGGDIDHIAGATITSRAARDALRNALHAAERQALKATP